MYLGIIPPNFRRNYFEFWARIGQHLKIHYGQDLQVFFNVFFDGIKCEKVQNNTSIPIPSPFAKSASKERAIHLS
jgi:hypothetical protein